MNTQKITLKPANAEILKKAGKVGASATAILAALTGVSMIVKKRKDTSVTPEHDEHSALTEEQKVEDAPLQDVHKTLTEEHDTEGTKQDEITETQENINEGNSLTTKTSASSTDKTDSGNQSSTNVKEKNGPSNTTDSDVVNQDDKIADVDEITKGIIEDVQIDDRDDVDLAFITFDTKVVDAFYCSDGSVVKGAYCHFPDGEYFVLADIDNDGVFTDILDLNGKQIELVDENGDIIDVIYPFTEDDILFAMENSNDYIGPESLPTGPDVVVVGSTPPSQPENPEEPADGEEDDIKDLVASILDLPFEESSTAQVVKQTIASAKQDSFDPTPLEPEPIDDTEIISESDETDFMAFLDEL